MVVSPSRAPIPLPGKPQKTDKITEGTHVLGGKFEYRDGLKPKKA
jgi:hypothetical protein